VSGRRRQRAFTLIELVLVLVLAGVALSAVVPSLTASGEARRLRGEATQVLSLLRLARTQAAAEGRPWRLAVDVANRRLWLEAQDGAAFVAADLSLATAVTLERAASVALRRDDGEPLPYVTFHPDGGVDAARIRLDGLRGGALQIAADVAGGRWSIQALPAAAS
jgi:type II secretion system protein H